MPSPKTVLVVDDDPDIRDLLRDTLLDAGYGVQIAPEGQAALALVRESLPDLMLLDLMMPGMNGWDLLAELHTRPKRFPVILLSAIPNLRHTAQQLGAEGYLCKPFSLGQVLATVSHCLG